MKSSDFLCSIFILFHLKLVKSNGIVGEKASVLENVTIFEEDIIPLWETIAPRYGEDYASKLGLKPSTYSKVAPENRINYMWRIYIEDSGKYYIPYAFGRGANGYYTRDEKDFISNAFHELADMVNVIEFRERRNEKEYVLVKNNGGCSSYIGRVGLIIGTGWQELNIGSCKNHKGKIQHEIMHVLGLYHEQSRKDRDQHVVVNYDNIGYGSGIQFAKAIYSNSLGSPYDYCSIMHYDNDAFGRYFGAITMEPIPGKTGCESYTNGPFGQREKPSELDIQQLRLMYQCVGDNLIRNTWDFKKNMCTSQCKCWEGAFGCNSDDECFPDLVCRQQSCTIAVPSKFPTKSPSSSPIKNPTKTPTYFPSIMVSNTPTNSPTLRKTKPILSTNNDLYPDCYRKRIFNDMNIDKLSVSLIRLLTLNILTKEK